MKQDSNLDIQIILASLADHPTIQNMARFYVYDLSKTCGFISKSWACPNDGLFESFDFKGFFVDSDKKAFIIKVEKELAGFVLLHQIRTSKGLKWNMAEFFIMGKFQGKGIGEKVAQRILYDHPGQWEISVIPENKPGLSFWRKVIPSFTNGDCIEVIKDIDYDKDQPKRYIFSFVSNKDYL